MFMWQFTIHKYSFSKLTNIINDLVSSIYGRPTAQYIMQPPQCIRGINVEPK